MTHPVLVLLEGIVQRVAHQPTAQAVLALGSAGLHRQRLDDHSDLDFFLIATDPVPFLADLSWLGEDVRWSHRNTADGYQALVGGLFCEFAVLAPDRLPDIPYRPGLVVWAREGFDTAELQRADPPAADPAWLVDEVLSALFIGLHRWLRGERLAAARMVQGPAVDTLLRLLARPDDPFVPARRAESRVDLPWAELVGGYAATPRSARAILDLLPQGGAPLREEVQRLLDACSGGVS